MKNQETVYNIKLSVCVITFNQEAYIDECIKSILNQELDFDFEIIIGDDCSTDNTQKIIKDYQSKYPNKIKPIFREKNIGAMANYIDTYNHASGEYIAHCDGDDYFMPQKLATQVGFLEKSPDYSFTYTRTLVFNDKGESWITPNATSIFPGNTFTTHDLLKLGSIGVHSSIMFRNSARLTRFTKENLLDYYWALEYSLSGKGYFFPDVLTAYRHNQDVSTSYTTRPENFIRRQLLFIEHHSTFQKNDRSLRKPKLIGALSFLIINIKNKRLSLAFLLSKIIYRNITYFNPTCIIKNIKILRSLKTKR